MIIVFTLLSTYLGAAENIGNPPFYSSMDTHHAGIFQIYNTYSQTMFIHSSCQAIHQYGLSPTTTVQHLPAQMRRERNQASTKHWFQEHSCLL